MKQTLKKLLALIPRDESGIEPQGFSYTSPPATLHFRSAINVCASYIFPSNMTALEYSAWLQNKYPLTARSLSLIDIRRDFLELLKLNPQLESINAGYDIEMMRHVMWCASSMFLPDDISWLAVGGMDINNVMYEKPGYADLFLRLNDGLEEYGSLGWLPHPTTLLSIYEQAKKLGLIDNPYIDSYAVSLRKGHELQEN